MTECDAGQLPKGYQGSSAILLYVHVIASFPASGLTSRWLNVIMKCAIAAQSAQTAQLHLGNNRTLAQLKVGIVMSIHIMEKVVVLNMLIANYCAIHKFCAVCADCAFHNFFANPYFSWRKWLARLGACTVMEDL